MLERKGLVLLCKIIGGRGEEMCVTKRNSITNTDTFSEAGWL